jgi:hypothetical protein
VQEHFAFLPLGSLMTQRPDIFGAIAQQERVFIRPDSIYVMDVGSVGDRLAVIEVGSVNACGSYGADMAVIKAVSEEAEKAWRLSRDNAP